MFVLNVIGAYSFTYTSCTRMCINTYIYLSYIYSCVCMAYICVVIECVFLVHMLTCVHECLCVLFLKCTSMNCDRCIHV